MQSGAQDQFLTVVDRDEAVRRFHTHLRLEPVGVEVVPLASAHERVLAEDILAGIDVPGFDRANVDGFAVRAESTFGAMEESPRRLRLTGESIRPGERPTREIGPGQASQIATGAVVPRGADAIVMVEDTDLVPGAAGLELEITRSVGAGDNVSFAGSDIARGETILRAGQLITSRELGVLAALGLAEVTVYRQPRVAILSTGDELVAAGKPLQPGQIYDSNGPMLASAVRECGGEPVLLGIVNDHTADLETHLARGLACDVVLLSGGTSKGAGDLSYRVVEGLRDPGVVVHGVALKPGKPLCLAVTNGKPVAVLPGFPTSALFTFHEFLAPVIRRLAGRPETARETLPARMAVKLNSDRGRTEYILVSLMPSAAGLVAFPLGKGSGSVTMFSLADGFVAIDQHTELVEAQTECTVQLLSRQSRPADLVVIGSHCLGLDLLVGRLQRQGFSVKTLWVGSQGGLAAAKRGQCDLAGMHLLDVSTGEYNRPFLTDEFDLLPGYERMQGLLFRAGDPRFAGADVPAIVHRVSRDANCLMVNRNAGSGTRILLDALLQGHRPGGYAVQVKSHTAVAAAIAQGRADWGLAISSVASAYGLEFRPYRPEQYDFVIPCARRDRPAVQAFKQLLADPEVRQQLAALGCASVGWALPTNAHQFPPTK